MSSVRMQLVQLIWHISLYISSNNHLFSNSSRCLLQICVQPKQREKEVDLTRFEKQNKYSFKHHIYNYRESVIREKLVNIVINADHIYLWFKPRIFHSLYHY